MQLVQCGKHPYAPLAPHGLKDATVDLDVIRAWFDEHYWLSYGIVTASCSSSILTPAMAATRPGLDQRSANSRPAAYVASAHGGGGEHICFQNTLGIKGGDFDRGIEIKAKGGYVVGVGCKHVSGRLYAWQPQCSPKDAPLAEPPPGSPS